MDQMLAPANYGIKETREALKFGLALLVAGSMFAQKKPAEGSTKLVESVGALYPALEGIGQVDDEVKELDAGEIDTLVADVQTELPHLVPEKALKVARLALTVGAVLYKGILELKETSPA